MLLAASGHGDGVVLSRVSWQSKVELPVPVPIIFETERFDQLVRRALRQPRARARVVYLGPRY